MPDPARGLVRGGLPNNRGAVAAADRRGGAAEAAAGDSGRRARPCPAGTAAACRVRWASNRVGLPSGSPEGSEAAEAVAAPIGPRPRWRPAGRAAKALRRSAQAVFLHEHGTWWSPPRKDVCRLHPDVGNDNVGRRPAGGKDRPPVGSGRAETVEPIFFPFANESVFL